MSNTPLEYALAFAKAGFHLFPCRRQADAQDKRPHIDGWRELATTSEQQILAWSKLFPGCRWGVECQKTGLFIVDSDLKDGKNGENSLALLQADHGALPETYMVRTRSGGKHRYFRGAAKNAAENLGPALDTRSVGGYAIIPDGVDYVPLNQAPIAEAPKWILDKAGKPGEKERPADADTPAPGVELDKHERLLDAIHYAQHDAPGASIGARDDTAYRVACAVRDFGLSYQAAVKVMLEFWAPRPDVQLTADFDESHVQWKVEQAYKTAKNKLGATLPEAVFSAIPCAAGEFYDAGDIDARIIPKREWLLGTWFIKRFLTVTVAPGGTGKSNLSILEALSVATGRELSGDYVHEKGNVWLHNGEDPLDEIARRISAACSTHKVRPNEIKGRFFYTSGRNMPLKLVLEANRQLYKNEPAIAKARQFISENNIKLWVVDPFVDMHDCDENGNRAINAVAKVLSGLADETGCAIHVVHHTKKKGKDGDPTDQDAARGASALMAAARIGRNMNSMNEKDAKDFILPLPYFWYVRLDSSKANLSSPTDQTVWFEKVDVELPNSDRVGTLKPVKLEKFGAGDKNDLLRRKAITMIDEAGGTLTVNQIGTALSADPDISLSRNSISNRLIGEVFAHTFITQEGVEYKLVYPPGGARKGISVVRSDDVRMSK